MGGIVIRAEHGGEAFAGTVMDDTEEFTFLGTAAVPILFYTDPPSIGEHETRNVDRLRRGMGRASAASGYIAARIAAKGFDPRNR